MDENSSHYTNEYGLTLVVWSLFVFASLGKFASQFMGFKQSNHNSTTVDNWQLFYLPNALK